jgi:hypothetical protein
MVEHVWTELVGDGGPVGSYDYTKCARCGAALSRWLGKGLRKAAPERIFYANGSGLDLPADCDEAERMIKAFEMGVKFGIYQAEHFREEKKRLSGAGFKKIK